MDVSIVAAIGSFVISERMIRPKALVASGLAVLLLHDLATHSNDPASLKIYRGPGLLAFALFCGALSLRMWRRNGIACDELIFLPGTPLEDERQRHGDCREEFINLVHCHRRSSSSNSSSSSMAPNNSTDELVVSPNRTSSLSDLQQLLSSSTSSQEGGESSTELTATMRREMEERIEEERLMNNFMCGLRLRRPFYYQRTNTNNQDTSSSSTDVNTTNDDIHWAYSPSGASVLGAALDLALPVLLNFHLFIAAFSHPRYAGSQTPKIFPLIFLSVLTLRSIFPRSKRKRFWGSIRFTMFSPIFAVKFRDEIIGDVLTSLVRPIQDICFAYFYYFTVLRYGIANAAAICEQSRMLNAVVLPSCAILPLWWRFLQCLRQSRDNATRWPYYGNALKYLAAAMIVLNDIGHTADGSPDTEWYDRTWWVISFVLATLYQIWWDVFFDWELLVITPQVNRSEIATCPKLSSSFSSFTYISDYFGLATVLLQPLQTFRNQYLYFPGDQVSLRQKRMYKSEQLYWGIFILNCIFRFLWMLSFIPAKHISPVSGAMVNSFSSDVQSYVGPIIAGGEIIRRCIWGILRVELESMKLHPSTEEIDSKQNEDEDIIELTELVSSPLIIELSHSSNANTKPRAAFCSSVEMCFEKTRPLEPLVWIAVFVYGGLRAVSR